MKVSSKRNYFDVIASKYRPDRHHCASQVFLSQPNRHQLYTCRTLTTAYHFVVNNKLQRKE